jgi:hypothetical protein
VIAGPRLSSQPAHPDPDATIPATDARQGLRITIGHFGDPVNFDDRLLPSGPGPSAIQAWENFMSEAPSVIGYLPNRESQDMFSS